MKLLFLDQFSELGGAQQCLLDLLPALERAVVQQAVVQQAVVEQAVVQRAIVAMPGDGPMFERVRALGFETARIHCGPYASRAKTARDMARFIFETPRLARQIRELARAADIVYINGPRLLPAAALSGIRKPVVFHSHSYLPPGPVREFSGLALRRLRAQVIASCRYVAEPWKPYAIGISVVYNGVAGPERPRPERNGPPTIGCIGRIAPEKGQREFVEVARIIHGRMPEARFAIYGETMFASRDYEREVRAAAAGLPIEFAGWAPNVYDALASIDVLLVPSAPHEATTRVILEAFAAGVPVIAFPSGGIPEVLPLSALAHSVQEMAEMACRSDRQVGPSHTALDFTLKRYRAEILNVLWGRMASCGRLSTGPPSPDSPKLNS
jgi:glycosyltransferase involved in cell wall biosynthesis